MSNINAVWTHKRSCTYFTVSHTEHLCGDDTSAAQYDAVC